MNWNFDNSYSRLSDAFKEHIEPIAVKNPELVLMNQDLAEELNLDFSKINKNELAALFTGNILPKGNVTKGDIYKLMPFENELVVVELTKGEFIELINYLISRNGEPFSGMELKVFSDQNYKYKFNNNFTFQNNKKLKILTSDYLANGGDNMFFFKKKTQKKLNIKLRDVIIKYCKSKQIINSKTDERLIFIKNEE